MKHKFTPLFEMAHEISSSDSQVDNVQMFKVNIIYHCYRAVARKKIMTEAISMVKFSPSVFRMLNKQK